MKFHASPNAMLNSATVEGRFFARLVTARYFVAAARTVAIPDADAVVIARIADVLERFSNLSPEEELAVLDVQASAAKTAGRTHDAWSLDQRIIRLRKKIGAATRATDFASGVHPRRSSADVGIRGKAGPK